MNACRPRPHPVNVAMAIEHIGFDYDCASLEIGEAKEPLVEGVGAGCTSPEAYPAIEACIRRLDTLSKVEAAYKKAVPPMQDRSAVDTWFY